MNSVKYPIFELSNLKKGIFQNRPNRFIGEIEYKGNIELAHIHDPGRLKELLVPGAEVLFTDSRGKLKYYIKAVRINDEWVLIDTALHSRIAMKVFEYLPKFKSVKEVKKEVFIGRSRIDFMLDGIPLEVKGVTLIKDNVALFPDAPTIRGTRHINEVIKHNGIILFLIFRKAEEFAPNWETDPQFSKRLSEARSKNIPIIAIQISFDGRLLYYQGKIPLGDF
ncbi:MAG: DNA/RNA nuclease SfsA [Promethearchaeota archaeon]